MPVTTRSAAGPEVGNRATAAAKPKGISKPKRGTKRISTNTKTPSSKLATTTTTRKYKVLAKPLPPNDRPRTYRGGKYDVDKWSDFVSKTLFMRPEHVPSDFETTWLSNPIHPLFACGRFSKIPKFSVIEQSMRLASKFLESGVLDTFFHTLAFKSVSPVPTPKDRTYERCQFSSADADLNRKLTPREKLSVTKMLRALSRHVSWMLDDHLSLGAHTIPLSHDVPQFPNGHASTIHISRSVYDQLEAAADDLPKLLMLRLELAVTVLHETAHACQNLIRGKLPFYEPFFGSDAVVAEVGYDLESRLFGGHLDRIYHEDRYTKVVEGSSLKGVRVVREWPYQFVVEEYRRWDESMEVRREPEATRGLELSWRVHMERVRELFRDSFWELLAGCEPHRIFNTMKSRVGYCFRVEGEHLFPVAISGQEDKYFDTRTHKRDVTGDIVGLKRR